MIIAVVVFFLTINMPKVPLGIGPGEYPRVVGLGLFILGGILAVQSRHKGSPSIKDLYPAGSLKKVCVLAGVTFIYIKLLEYLGFVLLTPVFLVCVMLLFGERRLYISVPISLGVTLGIYYVFHNVFHVLLPRFTLF